MRQPLQTSRLYNIEHRGSNGELPEETAPAYEVRPYTYRNENVFLHLNFHQDPYTEYEYWTNKIGVDELFTDFTGSLQNFQEWTSYLSSNDTDNDSASKLLHKIAAVLSSYTKF